MRKRVLLVASLATWAFACQVLAGIHDDDFVVPVVDGGIGDGDTVFLDGGTMLIPSEACAKGGTLLAPVGLLDGKQYAPLVFALSDLGIAGFDDPPGASQPGYNLDYRCSCDPTDPRPGTGNASCILPQNPLVPDGCDIDGGIDNSFSAVANENAVLTGLIVSALRDEFKCGAENFLFAIGGYNFEADDAEIQMLGIPSLGMQGYYVSDAGDDAGDAGADAALSKCNHLPPKNDGTDVWYVEETIYNSKGTVEHPDVPNLGVGAPAGFVHDYRLVVDLRGNPYKFAFSFASQTLEVGSAVLVATLVPIGADGQELPIVNGTTAVTPTTFHLKDAVISGRAEANGVLRVIASGSVPGEDVPLCKSALGGPQYDAFRTQICDARDLADLPKNDNVGVACNAISLGFRFDAVPANIGSNKAVTAPTPNDCNTTCDGEP